MEQKGKRREGSIITSRLLIDSMSLHTYPALWATSGWLRVGPRGDFPGYESRGLKRLGLYEAALLISRWRRSGGRGLRRHPYGAGHTRCAKSGGEGAARP